MNFRWCGIMIFFNLIDFSLLIFHFQLHWSLFFQISYFIFKLFIFSNLSSCKLRFLALNFSFYYNIHSFLYLFLQNNVFDPIVRLSSRCTSCVSLLYPIKSREQQNVECKSQNTGTSPVSIVSSICDKETSPMKSQQYDCLNKA